MLCLTIFIYLLYFFLTLIQSTLFFFFKFWFILFYLIYFYIFSEPFKEIFEICIGIVLVEDNTNKFIHFYLEIIIFIKSFKYFIEDGEIFGFCEIFHIKFIHAGFFEFFETDIFGVIKVNLSEYGSDFSFIFIFIFFYIFNKFFHLFINLDLVNILLNRKSSLTHFSISFLSIFN
jgi:hypothetical protein